MDFYEFILNLMNKLNQSFDDNKQNIVSFLEDNDWFNAKPTFTKGKLIISDEQQQILTQHISDLFNENLSVQDQFASKFPETSKWLNEYFKIINATDETCFYVTDFLLYSLHKDVFLMPDTEIEALVEKAAFDLIKYHGEVFVDFLSWLKTKIRTKYRKEYLMEKRYTAGESGYAYNFDEYLELLYYLYNEDYITENDMYKRAAESKNYADTWLFLSMHFICALRTTDIKRIAHPILPKEPELILDEIKQGIYPEKDARAALLSITWRLCVLPLTPNKTQGTSGVSSIKFCIPESCEVHIGTLFSICEAHRLLAEIPDDEPLLRKIVDYGQISRYMGDEIGSLFLEKNFRTRSANKSYMQSQFMLADEILDGEPGLNIKGYMLAALARSHKGAYGEFASTTAIYLKDAKLSGLTPEFVARELFERGVLSFIPSMMLKMITDGEYNKISVENQTEMIKALDMTPLETESLMSYTDLNQKNAIKIVKSMFDSNIPKEDMLIILHRIGSGEAFSKQDETECLMSAMHKPCPYNDTEHCLCCDYKIMTKSVLYLLIQEYNRMLSLTNACTDTIEKNKYKELLKDIVLPNLDEILCCIKDTYGEQVFQSYTEYIKENTI